MDESTMTTAIASAAAGIGAAFATGLLFKKINEKRKRKAEMEKLQELVVDFPGLLARIGKFTDTEVDEFKATLVNTSMKYGHNPRIAVMLRTKATDLSMSPDDVRKFFSRLKEMDVICNKHIKMSCDILERYRRQHSLIFWDEMEKIKKEERNIDCPYNT